MSVGIGIGVRILTLVGLVWWASPVTAQPATTAPAAGTSGATPRHYAVLSMIGDSLTLVTHRPVTGGNLSANQRDMVPVTDTVFDHTALVAAHEMIRGAVPGAKVSMLAAAGPSAFAEQGKWLDGPRFLPPKWLAETLAGHKATHLVLITKYRSEVSVKFVGQVGGDGMLEGLGFYIDRHRKVIRSSDGTQSTGYMTPYAHFKIVLIDLSTATLLQEHRVAASFLVSAAQSTDGLNPWDALSNPEKILALQKLIDGEVEKALPDMLKAH